MAQTTMKALVYQTHGGPEVLEYVDHPMPVITVDQILLKMEAIGLNFADIYRRKGNYHQSGSSPWILGYEGAGTIVQVGEEVKDVRVGDRIAFADSPFSNAEYAAVHVDKCIRLPQDISCDIAASVLLQGLTAHYLVHDSFSIRKGSYALVHAAAGGVGQILIQLIRHLGGIPIGLTSSQENKKVALECGAHEVFLYSEDWIDRTVIYVSTSDIKKGGIDVVYDSVGSTLMDSFGAAKTGGTVVFYGMAGGDPPHVDPRYLMDRSLTLTGGDLWNVTTSRKIRQERSDYLFQCIREKSLTLADAKRFKLEEGAEAHRLLEGRSSTGKIILLP
ncbi:oxidoreductase, zinc-binding dehydrogenase family [Planoprotostelium fungivorum]|uniref:Oxidoreductase, zinc-binding dehydrogenase family n=1 Tax=Planoprotostelium fungivorum TaxID=1890364 RepID=A0A2P6MS90_9EUKA|nr:oxidoreductase, zinc-binding dehydrogenase family [Planoprotostelium fungivorum]PRP80365.1 oxidoreductase, zinc-binding dehydrogenase family [Planoprotostelium fungivorum]